MCKKARIIFVPNKTPQWDNWLGTNVYTIVVKGTHNLWEMIYQYLFCCKFISIILIVLSYDIFICKYVSLIYEPMGLPKSFNLCDFFSWRQNDFYTRLSLDSCIIVNINKNCYSNISERFAFFKCKIRNKEQFKKVHLDINLVSTKSGFKGLDIIYLFFIQKMIEKTKKNYKSTLKTSFMKPKKSYKWKSIHEKYTETGIS